MMMDPGKEVKSDDNDFVNMVIDSPSWISLASIAPDASKWLECQLRHNDDDGNDDGDEVRSKRRRLHGDTSDVSIVASAIAMIAEWQAGTATAPSMEVQRAIDNKEWSVVFQAAGKVIRRAKGELDRAAVIMLIEYMKKAKPAIDERVKSLLGDIHKTLHRTAFNINTNLGGDFMPNWVVQEVLEACALRGLDLALPRLSDTHTVEDDIYHELAPTMLLNRSSHDQLTMIDGQDKWTVGEEMRLETYRRAYSDSEADMLNLLMSTKTHAQLRKYLQSNKLRLDEKNHDDIVEKPVMSRTLFFIARHVAKLFGIHGGTKGLLEKHSTLWRFTAPPLLAQHIYSLGIDGHNRSKSKKEYAPVLVRADEVALLSTRYADYEDINVKCLRSLTIPREIATAITAGECITKESEPIVKKETVFKNGAVISLMSSIPPAGGPQIGSIYQEFKPIGDCVSIEVLPESKNVALQQENVDMLLEGDEHNLAALYSLSAQ